MHLEIGIISFSNSCTYDSSKLTFSCNVENCDEYFDRHCRWLRLVQVGGDGMGIICLGLVWRDGIMCCCNQSSTIEHQMLLLIVQKSDLIIYNSTKNIDFSNRITKCIRFNTECFLTAAKS